MNFVINTPGSRSIGRIEELRMRLDRGGRELILEGDAVLLHMETRRDPGTGEEFVALVYKLLTDS